MSNPSPHRLPETATPERYVIRLTPDLTHFIFTGEETITLTKTKRVTPREQRLMGSSTTDTAAGA